MELGRGFLYMSDISHRNQSEDFSSSSSSSSASSSSSSSSYSSASSSMMRDNLHDRTINIYKKDTNTLTAVLRLSAAFHRIQSTSEEDKDKGTDIPLR